MEKLQCFNVSSRNLQSANLIYILMLTLTCIHDAHTKIEYKNVEWFINGVDGPKQNYHACQFDDVVIDDLNEIIDTSANRKTIAEVQMVLYWNGNRVDVIPRTLFTTFPELEYFYINSGQTFEHLVGKSFENAVNLKVIRIYNNLIGLLDANLFAEALNLQHINLQHNKIEYVHRFAFSGLSNLKGVYLGGNKLKSLHSRTFSRISSLLVVDLANCNCINVKFNNIKINFNQIESNLASKCVYDVNMEYLMDLSRKILENDKKIAKLTEISLDFFKMGNSTEAQLNEIIENMIPFENITERLEKSEDRTQKNIEKLISILTIQKNSEKLQRFDENYGTNFKIVCGALITALTLMCAMGTCFIIILIKNTRKVQIRENSTVVEQIMLM